jgi:hypothetical protein
VIEHLHDSIIQIITFNNVAQIYSVHCASNSTHAYGRRA